MPPFRLVDLVSLLLVLAAAAGTRAWYLHAYCGDGHESPPLQAQGPPPTVATSGDDKQATNELDQLRHNLAGARAFRSTAPLARQEEPTAHVAPGYPWLLSLADALDDKDFFVRWGQCVLGALTAGLYFLFARRAFHSRTVAILAGLFCAVHPFWIVNTAEVNDGVLATFLLAASLTLGTRASQEAEAFPSLLFGLSLAGLVLVRASLLLFGGMGLLWFLLRCRELKRGWLCALLAVLGFANGVAPWTVRNIQTFRDVVPIADSLWLHVWIGNNRLANGGPQDESTLRAALSPERRQVLLAEESQPTRYNMLARDTWEDVSGDWPAAVRRRLQATLCFVFGQAWIQGAAAPGEVGTWTAPVPDVEYAGLVQIVLAATLFLGLLGWRWTYAWRRQAALAAVATVWVPLPYILSHGERLWGPRLPLDGVLLCYTAFALVCLLPRLRRPLLAGSR